MQTICFDDFYKDTFKKAFWFVYNRIPNEQDSEDILSDSYLALYESWQKINDNNYSNYFYRILINKTNNKLKEKYNMPTILLDESISGYDEKMFETKSPYNEFIKNKLLIIVKTLNTRDQKLFNLKYINNSSNKQIAETLNITTNNVKVLNNRLIKKLKELCKNLI